MDTVDPIRDIEIINTELILADLDSIQKRRTKQQKLAKGGDKKAQAGRLRFVLPRRLGEVTAVDDVSEADVAAALIRTTS